MCDHNYEFLWMSCRTPGSTQDATALACSDLGQLFKNRTHPVILQLITEGLCIAADEAYGDCELLATPWPGGGRGDEWRDAYNFFQSSARMHIEQAFGQLVGRWRIFWRPLRMLFFQASTSHQGGLPLAQLFPTKRLAAGPRSNDAGQGGRRRQVD